MQWSDQQKAIFEWFRTGKGNLAVCARAGSGKTSTTIEAIRFAPEKNILLCAFNKSIADELTSRISNPNAEAKTLHGVGFAAIRRHWERVRVDAKSRAESLALRVVGEQTSDELIRLLCKLHTKAREMAPLATDPKQLLRIAYQFECVPSEEFEAVGNDVDWLCARAIECMEIAANQRPTTGIDFADMLYLPVRNNWLRPRYDLVVVDEGQDLGFTQVMMARKIASGRIVVVYDDKQAIYAFRGADTAFVERLSTELNAKQLSLTVTYRCGRRIVDEARKLVPDFAAGSSNPEGKIRTLSSYDLPAQAQIGDFVLSRKNAPLVGIALKILRLGKRCKIEGRDIGRGLTSLIRRIATGKAKSSMGEFLAKLTRWEDREIARAEKSGDKGAEDRIDRIQDQAETIRALADGLSGVRELQARIEDLFADKERDRPERRVTCSSIHRAKGLEADRVFVLKDTLYPPIPCVCGHWASLHDGSGPCDKCDCEGMHEDSARAQEERNLAYVAITRAKQELVWVSGDK